MVRSELVRKLTSKNSHLYQRDLKRVVTEVLAEIVGALKEGQHPEIRGFGIFTVKERTARTGRNPHGGTIAGVTGKKAPAFKPGKEMHERLNKPSA